MKLMYRSLHGYIDFFDIATAVLLRDMLAPYLFKIGVDYVHRTSMDAIKMTLHKIKKKKSNDIPQRLKHTNQ